MSELFDLRLAYAKCVDRYDEVTRKVTIVRATLKENLFGNDVTFMRETLRLLRAERTYRYLKLKATLKALRRLEARQRLVEAGLVA